MQPEIPPIPAPPTVIIKNDVEIPHVDVGRPVLTEPVVRFKAAAAAAFSLACEVTLDFLIMSIRHETTEVMNGFYQKGDISI